MKQFLGERPGRIHWERLPAYSPELNPVELVWSQLKNRLKNQVYSNLEELTAAILEQVEGLREDTILVRSLFRKKEVGFITN